jgi:signal transduction histidine kinase
VGPDVPSRGGKQALEFELDFAPSLPRGVQTDAKRLQQILKNLLSNAFKFTDKGKVRQGISTAEDGWAPDNESLNKGASRHRVQRHRHRIGIPRREAADYLRGVPAGGRLNEPASTAARAWAGDQPRAGAAAGRRDQG